MWNQHLPILDSCVIMSMLEIMKIDLRKGGLVMQEDRRKRNKTEKLTIKGTALRVHSR